MSESNSETPNSTEVLKAGPGEVLIELASPALMTQLRQINQQHQVLNAQSQLLINGYVAGKGWNLETHNVSIDINSGMVTLTPKEDA